MLPWALPCRGPHAAAGTTLGPKSSNQLRPKRFVPCTLCLLPPFRFAHYFPGWPHDTRSPSAAAGAAALPAPPCPSRRQTACFPALKPTSLAHPPPALNPAIANIARVPSYRPFIPHPTAAVLRQALPCRRSRLGVPQLSLGGRAPLPRANTGTEAHIYMYWKITAQLPSLICKINICAVIFSTVVAERRGQTGLPTERGSDCRAVHEMHRNDAIIKL